MGAKKQRRLRARHLIVPMALAVTLVSTAIALTSSVGCGDDAPRVDAGGDGMPDTPIL